jgi:hypothetical protein
LAAWSRIANPFYRSLLRTRLPQLQVNKIHEAAADVAIGTVVSVNPWMS